MTDPITDMLNRISNAQAVKHETVEIPFSKFKLKIIEILKSKGFILDFKKREKKGTGVIRINLKYTSEGTPAISGFKRVSKSGQRIYKKTKEIRKVKGGYGQAIISTSKGLMTNKEAREQKLGGEVLCEIW